MNVTVPGVARPSSHMPDPKLLAAAQDNWMTSALDQVFKLLTKLLLTFVAAGLDLMADHVHLNT